MAIQKHLRCWSTGPLANPQGRVNRDHIMRHLHAFKNKNQNANLLIYRKKGKSNRMLHLADQRIRSLEEIQSGV